MPDVSKHPSAGGRRSFRALLRQVLHLRESPQRTAVAFALGVFIAFSPAYGLHTALVVLCTWLFGLNFLAMLAGAFINNPWTIIPILGATYWTGAFLLGRTDQPSFDWQDMSFSGIYQQVLPYAAPFVLGGSDPQCARSVVVLSGRLFPHFSKTIMSRPCPRTKPLPPSDQVS